VSLLRGILLENMGVKLVALVLALVVYLHVYTERPATMTVSFPVEVTDLSDSLAVVNPGATSVAAEVKGTGKQLIRLRLAEPHLKVSLAGVGPGHFQRTIGVQDLPIAEDGLTVSHFLGPQMIEMQIDRVLERIVPVAPRIDTALPAGVHWGGEWIATPDRVIVHGPRSVVAKLDSLHLAPVRLDAGRDTMRFVLAASPAPAGTQVTPPMVTLKVPIARMHH
jgi:hypothetical protein